MKNLFISLSAFTLLVGSLSAQTPTVQKDQSNLEKFFAKSGTLIEKKFIDIGKVRGVNIQVLTLTDLIYPGKVSGVRFEYQTATRYTTDTKVAFLDQDEIDGLVKSITLIKTRVLPSTPDHYTEVVFTSRSGFSAGCYYGDRIWKAFVKIERFDRDSNVFFEPEDLDGILKLLQDAKTNVSGQ